MVLQHLLQAQLNVEDGTKSVVTPRLLGADQHFRIWLDRLWILHEYADIMTPHSTLSAATSASSMTFATIGFARKEPKVG
mmetsp:Transcript_31486/g.55656  ORF Transcript_31486/g.55656 Transcript_31486/m.55656 type:complete len:80 (+) Transcript_31486:2531-2770(+)